MSAAAATACPRCGGPVGAGQEYCLTCGSRLPGPGRVGAAPLDPRALRLRVAALAALALAAAAVAIAVTREPAPRDVVETALGGSVPVKTAAVDARSRLAVWPSGRSAWTVIVLSVPKARGRDKAVAVAQQARRAGLTRVGILDSSRFASLRPGYWMVFAGIGDTQPEANAGLRRARVVSKSARVQEVTP